MFNIYYRGLSITISSAKTKQAACRLAFRYWISQKKINNQPLSSNDWSSSWEGVYVHHHN